MGYAKETERILQKAGLRCEVDGRAEKIGYKIRSARLERVPYMLVIGQKEMETGSVSVRRRQEGDLGNIPVGDLLEMLRKEGIQEGKIA